MNLAKYREIRLFIITNTTISYLLLRLKYNISPHVRVNLAYLLTLI